MASFDRKELILGILSAHNRFATVDQLCEELFSSPSTIRRELSLLESALLIKRVRGGAVLLDSNANDAPYEFRVSQNVVQKQIIAANACKHIKDGMTLFLDSSSTTYVLAQNLRNFKSLRIITNGLKTATYLSEQSNCIVMCAGGIVREPAKSMVGPEAIEFIIKYCADIAFISCRGFSFEKGAMEASEDEFFVKRQLMRNSDKSILLFDMSKYNRNSLCRMGMPNEFSSIYTEDKDINDRCAELINNMKLNQNHLCQGYK